MRLFSRLFLTSQPLCILWGHLLTEPLFPAQGYPKQEEFPSAQACELLTSQSLQQHRAPHWGIAVVSLAVCRTGSEAKRPYLSRDAGTQGWIATGFGGAEYVFLSSKGQ